MKLSPERFRERASAQPIESRSWLARLGLAFEVLIELVLGIFGALLLGLSLLAAAPLAARAAEAGAANAVAPAPSAPAASEPACLPPPAVPSAEQIVALQREAQDHGLLWRAEREGQRLWLYGTIHVARREWIFPGPATMAALRESTDLALELDLLDADLTARLGQQMRQPKNIAPLPAALALRLAQREAQECLGEALAPLYPELQVAGLGAMALRREGLDPAWALDAFLAGLGHGRKLRVHSLETPEQQIKLLVASSAQERQELVGQALDELESGRASAQLRRIAQVWAEGRLDELNRYAEWCDCMNTPAERAYMRRMLEERNAPMAERIARLSRPGRTLFVAVGSLHMIGPRGLPALLAARGYRVEQVWPQPAAVKPSSP